VSIVWLLVLALPGLTFLAVASVLAIGLIESRALTRVLLRERADTLLETVIADLGRHLDPVADQLATVAQNVAAGAVDTEDDDALYHYVAGLLTAVPQAAGIALARPDRQLNVFRRTGNRVERDRQRMPDPIRAWMEQPSRSDRARWIEPVWAPYFSRSMIVLLQPIHAPAGFVGALLVPVPVDGLSQRLAAEAAALSQTPFVVLAPDRVLAHPRLGKGAGGASPEQPLPTLAQLGDPVLAQLLAGGAQPLRQDATPAGTDGRRLMVDGQTYIGLFRMVARYGDTPWLIGSYFREAEIGAAELARIAHLAAGGGAILALAVLLSLAVGRLIGRPILRFARAANAIESGNFDAPRLPGNPIREFDQAAHAFNQMVDGLRDRARIRDLFGKYVPLEVAREVLADPGGLRLGGEKREITVLFSDIEAFTTLSEDLPPDRVLAVINAYFDGIGRILVEHGGIIVDFIGDAVFAIFGAPVAHPDHAQRALAAARAIVRFAAAFQIEQRNQGLALGPTRCGLHTGVAIVGNIGSLDRLKYGAAGDIVNIGSRLEGANKILGSRILASAETIRHAGDRDARPIGAIVLKGRHGAIDAHEVLEPGDAAAAWHADYLEAFARLDRRPAEAAAALRRLAMQRPDDRVIRGLLARLEAGSAGELITLTEK
jgi:class 3 adenylate cyclase